MEDVGKAERDSCWTIGGQVLQNPAARPSASQRHQHPAPSRGVCLLNESLVSFPGWDGEAQILNLCWVTSAHDLN